MPASHQRTPLAEQRGGIEIAVVEAHGVGVQNRLGMSMAAWASQPLDDGDVRPPAAFAHGLAGHRPPVRSSAASSGSSAARRLPPVDGPARRAARTLTFLGGMPSSFIRAAPGGEGPPEQVDIGDSHPVSCSAYCVAPGSARSASRRDRRREPVVVNARGFRLWPSPRVPLATRRRTDHFWAGNAVTTPPPAPA